MTARIPMLSSIASEHVTYPFSKLLQAARISNNDRQKATIVRMTASPMRMLLRRLCDAPSTLLIFTFLILDGTRAM